MESNGTRAVDGAVDWLTVSPKPQFHPASITTPHRFAMLRGPPKPDLAIAPPHRFAMLRGPAKPDLAIALVDGLPISELKVVIDDTVDDAVLARYEQRYHCGHYFAQPCMNDDYQHHLHHTLALVQARPSWRISLQLHKILGVP